jgi:hypothetical protein
MHESDAEDEDDDSKFDATFLRKQCPLYRNKYRMWNRFLLGPLAVRVYLLVLAPTRPVQQFKSGNHLGLKGNVSKDASS